MRNSLLAEGNRFTTALWMCYVGLGMGKKLMSKFSLARNATEIRNNSFNLFVNEKYGHKEIKDIVKAIKKVENYYLKNNIPLVKKNRSLDCCGFKNNTCKYLR